MHRFSLAILALLPAHASAWEFRPDPICTLSHSAEAARVVITYDPGAALYALTVTRNAGDWAASATFGMRFTGGVPVVIGTSQHSIDGPRLSVTDSGFGNVLNGLEFNTAATAFTDTQSVDLSLNGAAAPVQAFRACTEAPPASV